MRLVLTVLLALWAAVAGAQSLPHSIPDFCSSPTITSVANGPWTSASTWSPARVPQAGDKVLVAHNVTYGQVSDVALDCVGITGTLTFLINTNTRIKAGTFMVYASGTWTVGSEGSPVLPGNTAEIIIADKALGGGDPDQYGTGILGFGKVTMHGAIKSPTFARVTAELGAGATNISLEAAPGGWTAGDRLIVPASQQPFPDAEAYAPRWETPTLAGVSGSTLTTSALAYSHLGARNADNNALRFLPHVGNLSRNIILRSADPAGTRGHVLLTGRADVDIRYVLFKDLGRTTIAPLSASNIKGRYSLHLHHLIGPVVTPANGYQYTLIGNAIDGGTKWGITLHNTHYGLTQGNVLYDAAGAGIMTEDGNESFNVIEKNFVVRSYGTGEEQGIARNIWLDSGFEGSGIWLRGVNNYVRDNVVANSNSFAYGIYPQDLTTMRVPKWKGADVMVAGEYNIRDGQATPLLEFARNEVYASYSGITMWDVGADCCTQVREVGESVIKDFHAWHLGRHGFFGYGMNRVTFDSWVQRGESTYSWSPYVFTRGIWFGDYLSRNIVIRNADIQGVRAAIEFPYKAGDTADIYGFAPGTLLIENSKVVSYWGYISKPQYGVTGGGNSLPPRTVTVRNSTWSPVPWTIPEGWSQVGLARSFQIDARNANIMVADRVLVEDWQGNPADDFEAYYVAQTASYVPPPSSPTLVGSPEAGKTNAELLVTYGVTVAGAIAPCTNTRPDVEGFVCVTGAQPPPALTNFAARFSRGQVFLTWDENGASSYEIRRNGVLLATVAANSGLNRYTNTRFVVEDLGAPLAAGIGLFVDTPPISGTVTYTVTDGTVTLTSAPVSVTATDTPGAVLLSVDTSSPPLTVRRYFAWENYSQWNDSWGYYGHRFNVTVKGPLAPTATNPLVLDLHGAGASTYEEPPAWVDIPATGVYLFPVARTFTSGNVDPYSGNGALPNHFGQPAGSEVIGFNESRYLRYLRWVSADPQFLVDPNRIYAKGGSMGGGGALRIALRNPAVFAAAASSISYGSPGEWGNWTGFWGQNVGSVLWDNWESAEWLIANTPATTPIVHTFRKDDTIIPQGGKPALLAATEARHFPYIAQWQNGGHNVFWLSGPADFTRYKLNEAYPAFSGASSSDNTATAQEGQRNLHLDWSSSLHSLGAGTAISDSANAFGITLTSLQGTQTTSVTIRNAQAFKPASGASVNWTLPCGGLPEQSGTSTADSQGLVTLSVTLNTTPCRLSLTLGAQQPPTVTPPTNLRIIDPPSGPPSVSAMSRSFTASESDDIVVGDIAAIDITGTTWTIAVWVKLTSLSAERKIIAKWSDIDAAYQYLISVGTDGHVVGVTNNGSNNVITGSATLSTGTWYLIVLRQNGTGAGSLTLRVNGASDGSAAPSSGPSDTSVPLKLGAGGKSGTDEQPHDGLISRAAIWKTTALSDSQADDLLDTSPNGIGVSPDFYVISSVNELVDYAGGASLTDNGTTYSSDEPFVEGSASRYSFILLLGVR